MVQSFDSHIQHNKEEVSKANLLFYVNGRSEAEKIIPQDDAVCQD